MDSNKIKIKLRVSGHQEILSATKELAYHLKMVNKLQKRISKMRIKCSIDD